MLTETEFYYVRHGQTDWNVERRAQGQVDIPLNDTGRNQAQQAALSAKGLSFGAICSSPLARARHTAEAIQNVVGGEILIFDELREIGFGSREGDKIGTWTELWKRGVETPDGAETFEEFFARASRAINCALTERAPVLIVAHGGVYWPIRQFLGLDADYSLPNAQIVKHTPPSDKYPWWKTSTLI